MHFVWSFALCLVFWRCFQQNGFTFSSLGGKHRARRKDNSIYVLYYFILHLIFC